jgi:hypothetical protein
MPCLLIEMQGADLGPGSQPAVQITLIYDGRAREHARANEQMSAWKERGFDESAPATAPQDPTMFQDVPQKARESHPERGVAAISCVDK